MIKTRFAPSPTGDLHVGGARTALFAWAFARKFKGQFILRIEDTDHARSSRESTEGILDSMRWLGLTYNGEPHFQSKRLARYREVAERLIGEDKAYWCYASPDELSQMREAQRAQGLKPRYDGRWRPENIGNRPAPDNIKPVLRFRNPDNGTTSWSDLVRGKISISNGELDDLIIMRADGFPTYNFGVVVDDSDMQISHVIRGDDHINNTPRQINILKALNLSLPEYAHLPMILGSDGERLSKRHGADSVLAYKDAGYLPEAILNYLARLGWGHGNQEKFSIGQMIDWFSLNKVSKAPAKFDFEKLDWLNKEYIKDKPNEDLSDVISGEIDRVLGGQTENHPPVSSVIGLVKDRTKNTVELVESVLSFMQYAAPTSDLIEKYYTVDIYPCVNYFRQQLDHIPWDKEQISIAFKKSLSQYDKKFPQLAMPLRVMVMGIDQSPAINLTFEVLGRDKVCNRIDKELSRFVL